VAAPSRRKRVGHDDRALFVGVHEILARELHERFCRFEVKALCALADCLDVGRRRLCEASEDPVIEAALVVAQSARPRGAAPLGRDCGRLECDAHGSDRCAADALFISCRSASRTQRASGWPLIPASVWKTRQESA
jgi:hypothetical protein